MGVSWDPQDEEFTSSKNIFLLKIAFDAQFFRRGKSRSPMVLIKSSACGLIGEFDSNPDGFESNLDNAQF